jgi:hypothetical protein
MSYQKDYESKNLEKKVNRFLNKVFYQEVKGVLKNYVKRC